MCACNSEWTLIPYYHNSEVASTYYEHYQGRRLPDEHAPFKLSSRDTEKDENLGPRNLAYFAKEIESFDKRRHWTQHNFAFYSSTLYLPGFQDVAYSNSEHSRLYGIIRSRLCRQGKYNKMCSEEAACSKMPCGLMSIKYRAMSTELEAPAKFLVKSELFSLQFGGLQKAASHDSHLT
ncbi:hypothetical protein MG293_004670 [Ovis ammon polii]|uniref:Uncharacterized protein n=1 Tax=Ovis ammon polii TaxID=230172 RepID=A0AAD4YDW0_OVIAM|nr:hypothetical protein MG293_004670 [Ovis ammon polii]